MPEMALQLPFLTVMNRLSTVFLRHFMLILWIFKLRGAGYRLVYSVEDEIITVTVIGVGKRENDAVYKVTQHRS